MSHEILFWVGVLTFFSPFIIYAIEAREDDDFSIWMARKGINQITIMEGMILTGMLLINASPMIPGVR